MLTKEDYMRLPKERLAEMLVELQNKPITTPYVPAYPSIPYVPWWEHVWYRPLPPYTVTADTITTTKNE